MRRLAFLPVVLGAFLAPAIAACADADNWRGDVYPDGSDLTRSIHIGNYESLEACRAAAQAKLRELGATEAGDYECGLNCRPMFPELGDESVQVCKETRR